MMKEKKSPKEEHVEGKITELVNKIVDSQTEGDIHKYSANAIEKVKIRQGSERPVKIEVEMKSEVGFFQVEEVLIPKIQASPARHLIELYASVEGEDVKRYL